MSRPVQTRSSKSQTSTTPGQKAPQQKSLRSEDSLADLASKSVTNKGAQGRLLEVQKAAPKVNGPRNIALPSGQDSDAKSDGYKTLLNRSLSLEKTNKLLVRELDTLKRKTNNKITSLESQIVHLSNTVSALGHQVTREIRYAHLGKPAPSIDWSLGGDLIWLLREVASKGMKKALLEFKAYGTIKKSGLFEASFYAAQLNQKPMPHSALLRHYVAEGFKQKLDPTTHFSVSKYLDFYADVREAGIEPLSHYIRFGHREHRVAVASLARDQDLPKDFSTRSEGDFFDVVSSAEDADTPYFERRPKHKWTLADNPRLNKQKLGLYDIRPDDLVPLEGTKGDWFLKQFSLVSASPDFEGAVKYLNELKPAAQIVTDNKTPVDVSIVVPVYGQLGYTLNCLHALLSQASTYSFEIILGDDRSTDESGLWLPQLGFINYVLQAVNKGFILNCNACADLAHGSYIVMLNNDTRVVEGWLDEMILSFSTFPNAGLVGSKIFYPDGSLQEAGGIIWQDGSAWNYGRNDDPNRPRYCYARQVDYISGCAIALPSKVWKALGGFDEEFKPAYCEDSDICFRVRQLGYETWFQPLSRIIHYEGKTSGTDLLSGAKAYQITNSQKLFERWKTVLGSHAPNGFEPWIERERGVTKRVLVIDATSPTPWMDAGSVTTSITIKVFQAMGYKVHFIPQDNFLFEQRQMDALRRMGVECVYAPYEVLFSEYIRNHGHLFDVVQVFRFPVAEKIIADVRKYAPQAKVLFNNMDLHFLRLEREAQLAGDEKALLHSQEIKRRELAVIESVDCTIVPSTVEAELLSVAAPSSIVAVFPYMTDFVGTEVGANARNDIMFLGGFGHGPNVDAVVYFVGEVWPHLKDVLPDAKYLIVGAKPTEEVKALASDRIVVTGMVEDLGPWFDRSRVFAASIRYGAGVKGKVSTAMAHGVPVVATRCAAEGMGLVDGVSVLLADDPEAMAREIISLYRDDRLWDRLSVDSQAFVKEFNSFEMGIKTIDRILKLVETSHAA